MSKNFRVFVSLLILPFLVACNKIDIKTQFFAFSSYVSLNFYQNVNLDSYKEIITKYDELCDPYNSYEGINNVFTINESNDFIEVSNELLEILKYSEEMRINTLGYFNPLIGNLSFLWKKAIEENTLPSDVEIKKCVEEINDSKLVFNGNKVKIIGNANIDLGAVTKGFVLKKIKEKLSKDGLSQFIINAGTSSILFGEKRGKEFKVGVRNTTLSFQIKNTSLGTSSIDEQKLVIDGHTYSHIVNPYNGSSEMSHETILVINNDPALCDIYSTVLMMKNLNEIIEISTSLDLTIAVIDDGVLSYKSEGFNLK